MEDAFHPALLFETLHEFFQRTDQAALIDRISSIEDADLAEVVVALQQTDLSINALSAASGRVLGRSLFDYLG